MAQIARVQVEHNHILVISKTPQGKVVSVLDSDLKVVFQGDHGAAMRYVENAGDKARIEAISKDIAKRSEGAKPVVQKEKPSAPAK